jgi:hypothetical protein|tara:strand:- start:75 stop:539 length:465 start_codon:yes stop_codon:yes gene_type:complete
MQKESKPKTTSPSKEQLEQLSKFDIDLEFGESGESEFGELLRSQGRTCEVKSERDRWVETGNIAIEYWNDRTDKPSGISITESDFWVQCLYKDDKLVGFIGYTTEELKKELKYLRSIKNFWRDDIRVVNGGDDNKSKMILLPLVHLFKRIREEG